MSKTMQGRFWQQEDEKAGEGVGPSGETGREAAPGAFSPPVPGPFLRPAFLRLEAHTPLFPTPEREATEGPVNERMPVQGR